MNKIKKLVLVIILMILSVVILFVVNNNDGNLNHEADSSQAITSQVLNNNDTDNHTASLSQISSNTTEETDSQEFITFIKELPQNGEKKFYFAVSWNKNGKEIFSNTSGEFVDYEGSYPFSIGREEENDMIDIYGEDYFHPASSNFDNLKTESIIKSNGKWNFTPTKVTYTNYLTDNMSTPEKSWINYFDEIINSHSPGGTPIIITESWVFQYKGNLYSAVNCSNIIDINSSYQNKYPIELPNNSDISRIAYNLSAIFVNNTPINTHCTIYSIPLEANEENISLTSTIKLNDHIYDILQYSSQGDLCRIQIFNNGDIYNYFPFINAKFSYYFYDIDGDDKIEIVYQRRARSSIYSQVRIYEIDGDNIKEEFRA